MKDPIFEDDLNDPDERDHDLLFFLHEIKRRISMLRMFEID